MIHTADGAGNGNPAPSHDPATTKQQVTDSVTADYVTLLQRRALAAINDSRATVADVRQRGYEAGYLAAVAHVKRTEHELVDELGKTTRWSIRGQQRTRATFADPHPRDFTAGQLPLEHPGEMYLGGEPVHGGHECNAACKAIRPGWYPRGAL